MQSADRMISSVHLILYVTDQMAATAFWHAVLDRQPVLDEPGMTEFRLGDEVVLGLMPETGIKTLLGPTLPDPGSAHGIPRAEVYLAVSNPAGCHARALAAGATEVSALAVRSWGDAVAYSLDPDGHVLALAGKQRHDRPADRDELPESGVPGASVGPVEVVRRRNRGDHRDQEASPPAGTDARRSG